MESNTNTDTNSKANDFLKKSALNILDLDTPDLFKTDSEDTESITIDNVFKNVTALYDKKTLVIVFKLLQLMTECDNEIYITQYISGLNSILKPTNRNIRNWIQSNLTL